mmetsp:Transcript_150211/g.262442  ORF Transcript_150211/g.262442 Transcript_150211/m.262442 type:complete len:218 (-) Transcript_150211:366-1019(-)
MPLPGRGLRRGTVCGMPRPGSLCGRCGAGTVSSSTTRAARSRGWSGSERSSGRPTPILRIPSGCWWTCGSLGSCRAALGWPSSGVSVSSNRWCCCARRVCRCSLCPPVSGSVCWHWRGSRHRGRQRVRYVTPGGNRALGNAAAAISSRGSCLHGRTPGAPGGTHRRPAAECPLLSRMLVPHKSSEPGIALVQVVRSVITVVRCMRMFLFPPKNACGV